MNEVASNSVNFIGYADAKSFFELVKRIKPPVKFLSKSGKIIISAVACVTTAVIVYASYVGGNISLLLPISVGIVVPIGFIVVISKLSTKQFIKTQRLNYEKSIQKEPRTGSISASGISFKIADGKTELQWAHFDRLVEIDEAFALCRQSRMIDAFSRSMFESKENFETV